MHIKRLLMYIGAVKVLEKRDENTQREEHTETDGRTAATTDKPGGPGARQRHGGVPKDDGRARRLGPGDERPANPAVLQQPHRQPPEDERGDAGGFPRTGRSNPEGPGSRPKPHPGERGRLHGLHELAFQHVAGGRAAGGRGNREEGYLGSRATQRAESALGRGPLEGLRLFCFTYVEEGECTDAGT